MQHQQRDRFLAELAAAKAVGDLKATAIANAIANNATQVVMHSLYCVKASGGAQTFPFTDASDLKETGINNFANSKLPASQILLISSIRLLGVELGAAPTKDTMKAANYGSIKGLQALQNGVMDIFSDGRIILKDYPLSNFITDNKQDVQLGTIHLASPKFVYPDADFKAEIRTGTATAANLVVKLELIGVGTQN